MRILENPFKKLSQHEIDFVRQFITESRDPECEKIINNAFLNGHDIFLDNIRYPLSRYVNSAFDVFVAKLQALRELKRLKKLYSFNSKSVDLICVLHKRPPKPDYKEVFQYVFVENFKYKEAFNVLEGKIKYPNVIRACQAFDEIVKLVASEYDLPTSKEDER